MDTERLVREVLGAQSQSEKDAFVVLTFLTERPEQTEH